MEIRTIDPADGQRLEDGEEQQAGSTAGEVVVYLEHIQTSLHGGGVTRPSFKIINLQDRVVHVRCDVPA